MEFPSHHRGVKKENSAEDRNKEQIIARSNLFNCNKIIPPHLNVLAMALLYITEWTKNNKFLRMNEEQHTAEQTGWCAYEKWNYGN